MTFTTGVDARARTVGRYVQGKVIRLQEGYLGSNPAAARAALAHLRRWGVDEGLSWMGVGSELFDGWDDAGLGSPEGRSKEFRAVRGALQLYALHQRSKTRPMALKLGDTEIRRDGRYLGNHRDGSFGAACRAIEYNLDEAKGVRRRLASVESAAGRGDFDGVMYGMRTLVEMLRWGEGIPLDYYRLASELYRIQTPATYESVVQIWSSDYFAMKEPAEASSSGL